MQTTANRPSRARKQTAAPFSSTAAKLIEQIQAEARAQLLADLSAKDAITVLHGFDAQTKQVWAGSESIRVFDANGNSMEMQRRREEPECWHNSIHMQGHWHPSYWYGSQTLVDQTGREFEHRFKPHVCDDFGELVEAVA